MRRKRFKISSLRGFTSTIMHRVIASYWRKHYRRQELAPMEHVSSETFELVDANSADPGKSDEDLVELLKKRKPKLVKLLLCQLKAGLTIVELAERFGISHQALKSRLKRARAELRLEIKRIDRMFPGCLPRNKGHRCGDNQQNDLGPIR